MFCLNEEEASGILAAYPRHTWQPLFNLVSEIEHKIVFDHSTCSDALQDGVIELYSPEEDAVVIRFRELVYQIPILIGFDWGKWDEGRTMANDPDFDFDTVDLLTKCKLITAVVRNDRHCPGVLVGTFETGLMLTLLKSIQRQVEVKS
jgi:hypothetical protein